MESLYRLLRGWPPAAENLSQRAQAGERGTVWGLSAVIGRGVRDSELPLDCDWLSSGGQYTATEMRLAGK